MRVDVLEWTLNDDDDDDDDCLTSFSSVSCQCSNLLSHPLLSPVKFHYHIIIIILFRT